MARLTWWIMVPALLCLFPVSLAMGQQGTKKNKPTSEALSLEVCTAVEQYIARIDAARSIKEQSKREEEYTAAKTELARVLEPRGKTALLAETAAYAQCSEQVIVTDSSDARYSELVDKRIKSRSSLLGRCLNFGDTRFGGAEKVAPRDKP